MHARRKSDPKGGRKKIAACWAKEKLAGGVLSAGRQAALGKEGGW